MILIEKILIIVILLLISFLAYNIATDLKQNIRKNFFYMNNIEFILKAFLMLVLYLFGVFIIGVLIYFLKYKF